MRFSEKETCKLAELYRQCDCLWNDNNANYKKKHVRKATWEAIAREMDIENFTAAEAKSKIKSLRGTYKMEVVKMEKDKNYRTNLKWFNIIDSVLKTIESNKLHNNNKNPLVENGEDKPESIHPDDNQWEQQLGSSVEIASESVLSPPSESEIEQSIRSISDNVIALTPEIQSVESITNSDDYSIISELQRVVPVTHNQVVTTLPEIITVKAASRSEVTPVTSEIKTSKSISIPEIITVTSGIQQTIKSISNPAVSSAPLGSQTVNSASAPTIFALIPDIQTSKCIPTPRFVTVSAGNNQNVRFVSNSPGIKLTPETKQNVKQVSADEIHNNRKRHHEEVSSTDSNTDVRQINNTTTANGDFSDRNEDEMDAFGHFVAMNLKKMSMQSALSAQSDILSILTRHRLNDSATNTPSKPSFPFIVSNTNAQNQNPIVLQKIFLPT